MALPEYLDSGKYFASARSGGQACNARLATWAIGGRASRDACGARHRIFNHVNDANCFELTSPKNVKQDGQAAHGRDEAQQNA